MKKLFKNKIFKGIIGMLLCACVLLFSAVIGINAYMISFSKKNFVTVDELKADSYDCILVLGAGLWSGKPSPMLKERLDFSLEAYNKNCSDDSQTFLLISWCYIHFHSFRTNILDKFSFFLL